MKFLLTILFFSQSIFAFSQYKDFHDESDNSKLFVTSYKIAGYIDKVRLDSVNTTYATISTDVDHLFFDYGQQFKKIKESIIKDAKGNPIMFENPTSPTILNFCNYNGWELVHVYEQRSPSQVYFLLKRK